MQNAANWAILSGLWGGPWPPPWNRLNAGVNCVKGASTAAGELHKRGILPCYFRKTSKTDSPKSARPKDMSGNMFGPTSFEKI